MSLFDIRKIVIQIEDMKKDMNKAMVPAASKVTVASGLLAERGVHRFLHKTRTDP
ncbi:MAG: hypothetical protein GY820_32935 [Gammaproteobacteria bacterium]|nr:hypothetical protein [Gammaproteobacteria bacterium]